jgi:hypothetical protein
MIKRVDSLWSSNYSGNKYGYSYKGIEGDNWPISSYDDKFEQNESKFFSEYISDIVEEEAYVNNGVAVCNDIEFINKYLQVCLKAHYKITVLFCETERLLPKCNVNLTDVDKFRFIGFDYAYTIPDYYSCIFHDIPRVNEFNKFLLNEYGLINTIEEVCEFISLREKLKTNSVPSKFESGEFSIYKLWEYVGDMPIV